MKVAVVGAGWAGLACAVRATEAGHRVDLFEMAPRAGGRARSDADADETDNGQHLLLAGYDRTLALMRRVGVDPDAAFTRLPLALATPDGRGFALGPPLAGSRWLAAARALWRARGLGVADKLAALRCAADWRRRGFACAASLTVDELLRPLATPRLRALLLDPLCLSALNTPPAAASAQVWLAVMRDSVFGAAGAADLLVPRLPLSRLLPEPALAWLQARGATLHPRRRVTALQRDAGGWRLEADGGPPVDADQIVLATSATEAARLAAPWNAAWSECAAALPHEPIATLLLRLPRRPWPRPLLALDNDDHRRPAQFAFHRGAIDARSDRVALVVSAAAGWIARGTPALVEAALAQARAALAPGAAAADVALLDLRTERRATFRCVAGLLRPSAVIAQGLHAAGDYVAGPYPATLEAAVRAGEAAASAVANDAAV